MELKVNKYPDHLEELKKAICGKKMIGLFISDESKLSDFNLAKNNPHIKALFKKYNLDNSCKDLYIWEVLEKMHSFRPF